MEKKKKKKQKNKKKKEKKKKEKKKKKKKKEKKKKKKKKKKEKKKKNTCHLGPFGGRPPPTRVLAPRPTRVSPPPRSPAWRSFDAGIAVEQGIRRSVPEA